MPEKDPQTHEPHQSSFDKPRVVGIGALQELLKLPEPLGMTFIVAQHLDAERHSHLVEILQRVAPMRVETAEAGKPLEPDVIYVVAPGTIVTLEDDKLAVSARADSQGAYLPVDRLFRSMADAAGPSSIGIVLSGTGSDGAHGCQAIKAAGGITFAQSEASAQFFGMPHSAFITGCVDNLLSPSEIGAELRRLAARAGTFTDLGEIEGSEEEYRRILAIVKKTTGADFGGYRQNTVKRRIARRAVLGRCPSMREYLRVLEQRPDEAEALLKDILINVTSFFRDPESFDVLKKVVYPEIMKSKSAHSPIRIWVPGCSGGQEAYSIAMSLVEFFDDQTRRPPVQIFATDLSEALIAKAREGVFPKGIEAEVPVERLRRFFVPEGDAYRISKVIRDMCIFAKQNVATDPPFLRVDLISCRNVLIYFSSAMQQRILPMFHYALNPVGFLLLGSSESIGTFTDLFGVVDHKSRVFAKRMSASRPYVGFSVDTSRVGAPSPVKEVTWSQSAGTDWHRETDRVLLDRYAPPGVLVNYDLDILEYRGRTGRFLEPASGEPSNNLMRMAKFGLSRHVRKLVNDCRTAGTEVEKQRIALFDGDERLVFTLRCLPIRSLSADEICYLVLFEDAQDGFPGHGVRARTATKLAQYAARLLKARDKKEPAEVEVERLKDELRSTREYLETMIQEQEAANEELRSANEEILSSNEELQSTNEEVETAKEELQSLNEELTTVNEQLHQRNVELSRLNDDLSNFLGSSNIPMVVLDTELRIRRFTPAAEKMLHLLNGDAGRPIGNIKLPFTIPDFETKIRTVVSEMQPIQAEVEDDRGRSHVLKAAPYRASDNKIDGVVLVLIDVHDMKVTERSLRESEERFRLLMENLREYAIIFLDRDARIASWDEGASRMFGYSSSEALGAPFAMLFPPDESSKEKAAHEISTAEREGRTRGEMWLMRKDSSRFYASGVLRSLRSDDGKLRGFAKILGDETQTRETARKLSESSRRLELTLGAAKMGTWELEIPGRRCKLDANLAVLLRFPAAQNITIDLEELFRLVHADDRDTVRTAYESAIESSGELDIEFRVTRPNGDIVWLKNRGATFYDDGQIPLHLAGACVDITLRRQAEEELSRMRQDLEERVVNRTAELQAAKASLEAEVSLRKELGRLLQNAEEDQRRKLSLELHDEIGQQMTILVHGLRALSAGPVDGESLSRLLEVAVALEKGLRRISKELRPPALDDLGLEAAVRSLVADWSRDSGVDYDLAITGLDTRLSPETESAIYRVLQESLTNVLKHAKAKRVSVVIQHNAEETLLIVEDDGVGFEGTPGERSGLGLVGMRERAELLGGTLTFESSRSGGTTVFLKIPRRSRL